MNLNEENFYTGVNLLKEVIQSSRFPLYITGLYYIGKVMDALLEEGRFYFPLALSVIAGSGFCQEEWGNIIFHSSLLTVKAST